MHFFFYLVFLLRTFTNHRTAEERGGHFSDSLLPLPPASQTLRHQPGDYCRELTSAHSQQSDSNWELTCIIFKMIEGFKAYMILIHSRLQISNYMHLIQRSTAYSREYLSKDFHWGSGEGRGLLNGGAKLLGSLTQYRIM